MISAKGQLKNKVLLPATIGAIAYTIISLANMFFGIIPFKSEYIVIEYVVSAIILFAWIINNTFQFKKTSS